jgi:hypothetical protein
MGLCSLFRSKPVAASTAIGNMAAQFSKITFSTTQKKAVTDAINRIKTEENNFKAQSGQINKLKEEIGALNKSLKETKDKDQKDNLKKQIKGKEKDILVLEMKNYKCLLALLGSLKTIIKVTDSKKPGQSIVDTEKTLRHSLFDLTVVLEGKLKPLVKNSVFTLIGKMAEKDLDIAYEAAKAVSEEPHRSWSLVEVAEKAVSSDPQRALAIMDEIKDANAIKLAYSKVTGKLVSELDAGDARRIADQFLDANARQWALGKIA